MAIEWAREPVVVIGDEIAQMVLDGMEPEHPVCAPPWDDFIIEMNPSPWNFSFGPEHALEQATAVLLSFSVMTAQTIDGMFNRLSRRGLIEQEMATEGEQLMRDIRDSGGWVLAVEMFADLPSGVMPCFWTAVLVNPDGTLSEPYQKVLDLISNRIVDEPDDPANAVLDSWLDTALMVVSMVNCSNVGLDDETPSYPRPARRRLARKGKPLVTFKRLHIKPYKSHAPSGEHGEGGVAVHIVRGHFKTYTEERPLFGKRTGTYWWQPMLRGTENRFVLKDYEVDS
jgi:hypothetical protein